MNSKTPILIWYVVGLAPAFCMTHASNEEPANPPYIVEVVEACKHDNAFPNNRIGNECLVKLNGYFFDEPIWNVAGPLFYYVDVNIDTSAHACVVDDRDLHIISGDGL